MTAILQLAFALILVSPPAGLPESPPESTQISETSQPSQSDEDVVALLAAYLTESDDAGRSARQGQIARAVGLDLDRAARLLPAVAIWEPGDAQRGEIAVPDAGVRVLYRIHDPYDPSAASTPLVICLPPPDATPVAFLDEVSKALADPGGGGVIALAVSGLDDGMFPAAEGGVGKFTSILSEVQRRFRIDPDRVFLVGSSAGADLAMSLALAYPHLFTGVGVIDGYARMPLPEYAYPMVVENLAPLSIVSAWWLADLDDPQAVAELSRRDLFVAAHNRALRELAETCLPKFDGAEVEDESAAWDRVSTTMTGWLAQPPAQPDQRAAGGWIRFPPHGRVGWLEAAVIEEPIWTSQQLTVVTAQTDARDEFVRGVLEGRLAHLAGRIEGQTITITAHRCKRVNVCLREGMIDFSRPIVVNCNGILRYDGLVERRLVTMLETARQDFDFKRPAWARLSFRIDGPASQRD